MGDRLIGVVFSGRKCGKPKYFISFPPPIPSVALTLPFLPSPRPSQLALAKATLVQEQARSEELARQVGDGNEGLNTLAQV